MENQYGVEGAPKAPLGQARACTSQGLNVFWLLDRTTGEANDRFSLASRINYYRVLSKFSLQIAKVRPDFCHRVPVL